MIAFLGSTLAVPAAAHADPIPQVDWPSLIVKLDSYLRTGTETLQTQKLESHAAERHDQPLAQNGGNAWFGVAPSVTLVARDWGSAFRLAGDRLSVLDAMRLSQSTRMIMSRVRLSALGSSRFTPFAQLGFGEWRTDTNILPLYKRSTQIAAHVGGGFEMQLTRTWQTAVEVSGTAFIRDTREAEDLPATRMWSATLASRMQF